MTIQGDVTLVIIYVFTVAAVIASCGRYGYKKYLSAEVAPEFTDF